MDLRVMLTTTVFTAALKTFYSIESFAGLDCPFTLVSGIKPLALGCLPSSLYTFLEFVKRTSGLARDYRANDFPEFDRLHMGVSPHAALFNSLLST